MEHYTWNDYADKVFNLIHSRHLNATTIIGVNDYYGSDIINTKDGEHQKRSKDRNFPGKQKIDFFRNPHNKIHLQNILKIHFTSRYKDMHKRSIYHEKDNCVDIFLLCYKSP